MPRLAKLKPEHFIIIKIIDDLEDLVKNSRLRIAELKAALPRRNPAIDVKTKLYITHPLTGKRMYY